MQESRRPIRVLPPLVANQIAAGEVVERPASVVKELLENAIDAGATRLVVELEQGGIELVRVTDDGVGIPPDELPLALEPHATSKVWSPDDLARIATLGFRGEALASIASVSRLSIRSRTPGEAGATQIDQEGDRRTAPRPAPGAVGTSVGVRNLFFNTPARRKFLRTVQTEQERSVEVVRHVALAHPGVGVRLTCDGREVLDLPANQSPRARALAVLGGELAGELLDVAADRFDDARGLTLWGLAGTPSIARGSAKGQFVFVNGRPVRDRTIQHAIAEAYRGLIDASRYPTVVLMIEMSPEGVDVNVHPQKAEVRFRDSSMVHSTVLRALRDALRGADLTPALHASPAFQSLARQGVPASIPGSGLSGVGLSGLGPPGSGPPSSGPSVPNAAGAAAPWAGARAGASGDNVARFVEYFTRPAPAQRTLDLISVPALREALSPAAPDAASPAPVEVLAPDRAGAPDAGRPAWRDDPPGPLVPQEAPRVLQVHKSFLVTQDEQGVVIIDQHALHERVMFEYLLARVLGPEGRPLETQRLLSPAVVPCSPSQGERLGALRPLLARLGIECEALGPTTLGVQAFPSFLFERGVDPVEFMTGLLERIEQADFLREASHAGEAALREVLDMMSCKAAVKAGDRLTDLELGELVRLREDVERASSCPHGRPTSIRLSIRELEKLFGRT
ncbi:MAG: DNA mismatch repair endonuclease MutL [Planctomycetota bacterium]|nr:DNA mismatch repair endonuclease MutL [Planctomycetota bacterium]